jgi:hypothetical protein
LSPAIAGSGAALRASRIAICLHDTAVKEWCSP